METIGTITITTDAKDIWGEFFNLKIDGIDCTFPLEKKALPSGDRIYKITVHIASTVAIGLFVNWLSAQMNGHQESVIQIENQRITENHAQITNVIMQKVTINNYCGKEHPEVKGIPKE